MNFKTKTLRSEKYLKFVRLLPCAICKTMDGIEAHHISTGGMAMKGSDLQTVPLCRLHHAEYHQFGKETFWQRHNADRWEVVAKTLELYVEEKEIK